ncbi:MAG: ATP-dependent DNA helicase RecG, partial [Acidobacteriaceae bacterium]|nr:ATP-dependent DNA helicase RecG [Acidobacteriaceae bacterium]
MDLSTPLQYVKGIGPARAEMLEAKGLRVVSDLLYYAPFRYEDRRNVKQISQLAPGEKAAVLAHVAETKLSGFRRRSLGLFEATLHDGSGANLHARWFHGEHYADRLTPGTRVALFGKVELDGYQRSRLMVQPEVEMLSEDEEDETLHSGRIVAVYEAAGRVSTRVFRTLIDRLLKEAPMPEDALPASIRVRTGLPDLATALHDLHAPPADSDLALLNAFRTPA